jgi:hypothetical protein
MQPVGVIPLGLGSVLAEPGGLVDGFGSVFGEISDVAAGFFGAAEDAFDVHLVAKSNDMGGLS